MDAIEYKDLYPTGVQRMYCGQCSGYLDLTYSDFEKVVSGITVVVRSLPTLACPKCRSTFMPEQSRFAVIRLFEGALKRSQSEVHVTRRKIKKDFGFAQIPFIYDPDDYYYIPGLTREWNPGYLTPVFFNKRVLIKFDHSEDYHLRFGSRTYGTISTNSHTISFGINTNDKVVLWLGDIAGLPESEQYYLRSENVESDHCLGSEFYDGQIECKFTDPTAEELLVKSRSHFLQAAARHFRSRISHLDEETLDAIRDFSPPAVFTERESRRLSGLVNQICVESLDSGALGSLLRGRGIDAAGLGSLKRLEKLLDSEFPEAQISSLLCPLFVAYDLRVAYAHLTSKERSEELVRRVYQRLDLSAHARFEMIYGRLLNDLAKCFAALASLLATESSPGA